MTSTRDACYLQARKCEGWESEQPPHQGAGGEQRAPPPAKTEKEHVGFGDKCIPMKPSPQSQLMSKLISCLQ